MAMRLLFAVVPLMIAAAAAPATAREQATGPATAPGTSTPNVPPAIDEPYPGVMTLRVDGSDVERRVFRVTQTVPVKPGARQLTLLFPQWLPGHHASRGTLAELTELRFTAGGRPAAWRRDPQEVFAFHVDLPAGAREVTARFTYTSALAAGEGRIVFTDEMQNLQWERVSLYPAGHHVRRIRVRPTATFPAGWTAATALDGQSAPHTAHGGATVTWAETDYETLVDSPVFAGRHFRRWDLGQGVTLDTVADEPELLEATPAQIAAYRTLVDQTLALFGSRPFDDRYRFLLALTDRMGAIGLEHHRSSENQLEPDAFTQWDKHGWDRTLLPHELVHAWNGKFRRPAGLDTPDYRTPTINTLLWVYEGQTQFWGIVLGARSGLVPPEVALGQLASIAGLYSEQPGRAWRSVEDTTLDPIIAARKPKPFGSLARSEDYYNEGALIWLEADQLIRRGTRGRRSLDDFARAFFGIDGAGRRVVPYTFDDVVAALDRVHPHDWATFLRTRIEQPGQAPPVAGIALGGYRLAWKDTPNPYDQQRMDFTRTLSLYHSLGIVLSSEGRVTSVRWGSPAAEAGVVTGATILAANGRSYDAERIKAAVAAGRDGQPIELVVKRGETVRTVRIDHRGSLRWPWLEKAGGGAAGLDRLLAP